MSDVFIPLLFLAVCCVLSGPIALIISIIALNKTKENSAQPKRKTDNTDAPTKYIQTLAGTLAEIERTAPPPLPVIDEPIQPVEIIQQPKVQQESFNNYAQQQKQKDNRETAALEQRIGTRWILVAGIITVFVGVGFLLKYAYDNFSIGPVGRIIAVAIGGGIALLVGEITRRRDYGIVAKGVTALGFAMLYAAVFAAYQIYNLIGFGPAFVFATLITAAAMAYAVVLDEVLIAFLSLLGGFSTPAIAMSKINSPVPLFVYVLILGIGAMLCAYYRKWRVVNLLSFLGTFGLYTMWFEDSAYNAALCVGAIPPVGKTLFVLGWLVVFFAIYLVMPMLYGLIKKVKSGNEDVCLILANAAVTLYYLYTVLFDSYRDYLALAAVAMSAIHLAASEIANRRYKEDANLRLILQAIGIFFVTLAVPLYFKLNATTIAWACEAVILTLIGLRYKNLLTQAFGFLVMFASGVCLLCDLPMHTGKFAFIFNAEFGTWCFVAAAIYMCHLLYRKSQSLQDYSPIAQILYGFSVMALFAAASMEWFLHCKYNLLVEINIHCIAPGQLIIFAVIAIMFLPGLIRPKGVISEVISLALLAVGSLFTFISLSYLHCKSFTIFANLDFAAVFAFLMAILIYQIKYRKTSETFSEYFKTISQIVYGALGLLFLATISAEWYWYCKYDIVSANNHILLKGLTIIFTIVMLFFVIRPISPGGIVPAMLAAGLAIIGAMFTVISFPEFHNDSFAIFFNLNLAIAIIFIAGLFLAARLFWQTKEKEYDGRSFAFMFSLGAILTLWVILTEEIYLYFYCYNRFEEAMQNWKFLTQMYISVMWAAYGTALMITGFWRKIRTLRYISIALFAILLIKVFLIDTQEIKNIYRVAAFLVTGITLVGISYLYQFLKKKGFFDSLF